MSRLRNEKLLRRLARVALSYEDDRRWMLSEAEERFRRVMADYGRARRLLENAAVWRHDDELAYQWVREVVRAQARRLYQLRRETVALVRTFEPLMAEASAFVTKAAPKRKRVQAPAVTVLARFSVLPPARPKNRVRRRRGRRVAAVRYGTSSDEDGAARTGTGGLGLRFFVGGAGWWRGIGQGKVFSGLGLFNLVAGLVYFVAINSGGA